MTPITAVTQLTILDKAATATATTGPSPLPLIPRTPNSSRELRLVSACAYVPMRLCVCVCGRERRRGTPAQEREAAATAESNDLKREIGVAERYLHDARQRIALLSNELQNSRVSERAPLPTMRADRIGHFKPCMTDIYIHIDARMADYIRTHPYYL